MNFLRRIRPSKIKPMDWSPEKHRRSVRFTKLYLLSLLIALLILLLSGCSKAVSVTPMPPPPANLASNCPQVSLPPATLLDPERIIWEVELLAKYGDCAMRHRMTVDAWQQAVKTTQK